MNTYIPFSAIVEFGIKSNKTVKPVKSGGSYNNIKYFHVLSQNDTINKLTYYITESGLHMKLKLSTASSYSTGKPNLEI